MDEKGCGPNYIYIYDFFKKYMIKMYKFIRDISGQG